MGIVVNLKIGDSSQVIEKVFKMARF